MKTLKFKFDLNCKFAVYVPTTVDVSKRADNREVLEACLRAMSQMFGGATTTPAKGAWVTQGGDIVMEDVDIVYSYCTSEQAAEKFGDVLDLCETIKREMRQEAVTLEYNGQIKFV